MDDRRLLRILSPVLRPAALEPQLGDPRAIEGLEPYVQKRAKVVA